MWVLFCFEKPFEIIVDSHSVLRMHAERSWVSLLRVSWWWHLTNYGILSHVPHLCPRTLHQVGQKTVCFHHRRPFPAAFHGHVYSAPSGPYSALPVCNSILSITFTHNVCSHPSEHFSGCLSEMCVSIVGSFPLLRGAWWGRFVYPLSYRRTSVLTQLGASVNTAVGNIQE